MCMVFCLGQATWTSPSVVQCWETDGKWASPQQIPEHQSWFLLAPMKKKKNMILLILLLLSSPRGSCML